MPELPIALAVPFIDWRSVPRQLRDNYIGKVSAVCRTKEECADLVHWFGHEDFCPFLPVLITVPGAPQLLAGQGLSTASELRDMAVAIWEIITERLLKTGSTVNFDELREKNGQMRREEVDAAIRESFVDRIRRHRKNPRTDPPRVPHYVRINARTMHSVADPDSWRKP